MNGHSWRAPTNGGSRPLQRHSEPADQGPVSETKPPYFPHRCDRLFRAHRGRPGNVGRFSEADIRRHPYDRQVPLAYPSRHATPRSETGQAAQASDVIGCVTLSWPTKVALGSSPKAERYRALNRPRCERPCRSGSNIYFADVAASCPTPLSPTERACCVWPLRPCAQTPGRFGRSLRVARCRTTTP